jgi:hypothetical protein
VYAIIKQIEEGTMKKSMRRNSIFSLLLVLMLLFSISFNNATPVFAAEKEESSEEVLKIAFGNNLPTTDEVLQEQDIEVVYDSRYDDKPIIQSRAVPASYDYYKTYQTGVTCKGTGVASSYLLNANITFYVNVYFKSTKAVGYDSPVVTKVYGVYGATGYSKPSVKVSSWSSSKMTLKGTCTLTAGGTYTMTGTKTISLP